MKCMIDQTALHGMPKLLIEVPLPQDRPVVAAESAAAPPTL